MDCGACRGLSNLVPRPEALSTTVQQVLSGRPAALARLRPLLEYPAESQPAPIRARHWSRFGTGSPDISRDHEMRVSPDEALYSRSRTRLIEALALDWLVSGHRFQYTEFFEVG